MLSSTRVASAQVGILIVGILSVGVIAGGVRAQTASPEDVTIYRDNWGVPHIYADSEEAGFYALGYAQAEDKLLRILELYMGALGRSAEILGEAGLANDIHVRMWRHVEESRDAYERLSPQIRTDYRAFIAGMQTFMDENLEVVPDWAPQLEPFLPLLFERYVRWDVVIRSAVAECEKTGLPMPTEVALTDRGPTYPAYASNEWVLSPWRTADSVSIHLGDPHSASFGYRYEFFLKAGPFETMGHTDTGAALPILGHTRHVAWTWTTGAPDVSDCYRVQLSDDGERYLYDGEWVELVGGNATIVIKNGEPETRSFRYTRHNGILSPLVIRDGSVGYAISTPYMHTWEKWDEEMYRQNFARDVDEFRAAMAILGHHGENVMAADSKGNTLYVRTGKTPVRPAGFDWSQPVDGTTSATAWRGIHPIDDLVQIKNPPQGYMHNNNVPPYRIMEDSPLTSDRYPSYIYNTYTLERESGDDPRLPRGDLANEMLSKAYHVSSQEAIAMALDHRWPYTDRWLAALDGALDRNTSWVEQQPRESRLVADRLLRFDGKAVASSAAAATYYYWRTAMESLLPEEALRELMPRIDRGPGATPADDRVLYSAIPKAVEAMRRVHGSVSPILGDIFRVERGNYNESVSGPYFAVGGFGYAPLRVFYAGEPDERGVRWVWGGSKSLRLVLFTEPIQSFATVLWTTDDEASPHFRDQMSLLAEPRLKRNHFGREQLEGHIESTTVLRFEARR